MSKNKSKPQISNDLKSDANLTTDRSISDNPSMQHAISKWVDHPLIQNMENVSKRIFWPLVISMFILMPVLSFDFGITGDELVHKENGENVLKYLKSGGEDSTYRHYKNLYLYGGFFDATAAMIYESNENWDPYDVRHVLSALFGAALVLFTGLLARHITGSWLIALIACLFTLLSPRLFGDSMNNPKDIPFAAAYVMAILGIIRYNKFYPTWNWKAALFLLVAIAISINIRVGGLLLLAYFGVYTCLQIYTNRKKHPITSPNALRFLGLSALTGVVAYFVGLIFFPYSHEAPIGNTLSALKEMENFQTAIRMLFEGRAMWSDEIPWYYIPKWLSMALPLFILIGLVLFVVFSPSIFKKTQKLPLGFIVFVFAFPVLYAIYKHSALYDGIRHFLFIMPMLNIIAVLGWVASIIYLSKTKAWIGVAAVLGVLMILPLRFMVANHPNQYIYFNELVGGINGAHGYYETDYWMNSMKSLSYWLIENDERIKKGEEVIVCTNSIDPVKHYFETLAPNVKVLYAPYRERYRHKADYYLSIPRFIDSDLILKGSWPPKEVIRTVTVDGVPVGAISKYTDTTLVHAISEAKRGNFIGVKNDLEAAYKEEPLNEAVIYELANGYYAQDSLALSNAWVDKGLEIAPNYSELLLIKSLLLIRSNRVEDAYALLEKCIEMNYRNASAYYYKALILYNQKDFQSALDNIQQVLGYAPNYKPAYQLGAQIMQDAGNPQGAEQFLQAAQSIK